jgi:3-dehydroquinate dehydratase
MAGRGALAGAGIQAVELHLSTVHHDPFRHRSLVSDIAAMPG